MATGHVFFGSRVELSRNLSPLYVPRRILGQTLLRLHKGGMEEGVGVGGGRGVRVHRFKI